MGDDASCGIIPPTADEWLFHGGQARPGDAWNERLGCLVEDIPERARKLRECGAWLWFRQALEGELAGRHFLHAADFCGQFRLCQFCSIRRATRTVQAYAPKVVTQILEGGDRRALFVTLTQRTGEDLGECFERLNAALKRFNQNWRNASRRKNGLAPIAGGAGSIEVKRGRGSGGWHVHYHGVWLTDGYLDFENLQRVWSACTGQDVAICDFRELNAAKAWRERRLEVSLVQALAGDLIEVFKYAVKFGEMSYADTWEAFETLHGSRLLRSFGCLFDVKVLEGLTDEGPNWQEVSYADKFFRYIDGRYQEQAALRF